MCGFIFIDLSALLINNKSSLFIDIFVIWAFGIGPHNFFLFISLDELMNNDGGDEILVTPHSLIPRSPSDSGKSLPGSLPLRSSSRRIDKHGEGITFIIRSVVCWMDWKIKFNGKVIFGLSVGIVVLFLLYFYPICDSVFLCFAFYFLFLTLFYFFLCWMKVWRAER